MHPSITRTGGPHPTPERGLGMGMAASAEPIPRLNLGEEPDELRISDLCSVCGTCRRRTLHRLPGGTRGGSSPRHVRRLTGADRGADPGADPADRIEARTPLAGVLPAVAGLQAAHPPDLALEELIDVAVEHGAGVARLDARTQVLDDLVRVEHVVAVLGVFCVRRLVVWFVLVFGLL